MIILLYIVNSEMHRTSADQYLPSGRGEFTVRGVAEALEFISLAIVII